MRSFINIQMQSLYTPISSVPSTSCTVHTENLSLNLRIEAEHNTFSQFISDEYEKERNSEINKCIQKRSFKWKQTKKEYANVFYVEKEQ